MLHTIVLFGMSVQSKKGINKMEWISVKDRLPKVEEEVFIRCNRNGDEFTTTALFEDGTVLSEESLGNWRLIIDFKECERTFLIPEGWWEIKHFNPDNVYNNKVDCKVTHWMPLPEPPKQESEE